MKTTVAKKHGRNAFMFVLVTVFIDMVAFGLIMPVMPDLVTELTGQAATEAVAIGVWVTATYAAMNFLFGPTLGNLSDRYGRRPVLLFSVATLGVDFLIMALADSMWMLFLGRALAGISGATFSTAQAYIADVTEPEQRGDAFGKIGAAFGLGFIIGPALGAFLGQIDSRAPFYAAAAMSFLNFLYGMFVLPESLSKENRRPFDIKRANPFGAFRHFAKLPQIRLLLATFFLYGMAHAIYPAIWSWHGEIRYDWTAREIGLTLSLVGLSSAFFQGFLTGKIIARFGPERAIWIGLFGNLVAFTGFAIAFQDWMIYAFIALSGLGGVFGPSIHAMMSNNTAKDSQGELQGATASLQSMSMIFMPIIAGYMLAFFTGDGAPIEYAGAPFLLGSIIILCMIAPLSLGIARLQREKTENVSASDDASTTDTVVNDK